MAQRRMFSKTIIDSDAFLDMSLSTQALYFHLSMRADDEGFINNPKKIMRMIGASPDELKILIAKKFVLDFESGLIVIKHWMIHNQIRKDRTKDTVHQEERKLLDLKENGSYTFSKALKMLDGAERQPNVNQMSAQVSIGKVSIEEVSIDKDSIGTDVKSEIVTIPYELIVSKYNSILGNSLSKVMSITNSRKSKIKVRWNNDIKTIEDWESLFNKVAETPFLIGDNKQGWKCGFDWLITNDSNYLKVLEGNYNNTDESKVTINQKNNKFHNFSNVGNKYSNDELEKKLGIK